MQENLSMFKEKNTKIPKMQQLIHNLNAGRSIWKFAYPTGAVDVKPDPVPAEPVTRAGIIQ